MPRPLVVVRRVDEESIDTVCALWAQSRAIREPGSDVGARRLTVEMVRAALARPETAAFVATADGAPVGYAVVNDCSLNPFAELPCVGVEQLYVVPGARRQGVARALVQSVAAYADRHGAEHVSCTVPSSGREANRFFARLGFAPHVVRRVTTTAGLQRRLAADGEGPRRAVEQVLARRRVARVRAARSRLAAH